MKQPSSSAAERRTITILGCGDIGSRLAKQLDPERYQLVGLRRSKADSELPHRSYRQADTGDLQSLAAALPERSDAIVITMTPSERSDDGYRRAYVDTVENLIAALSSRPAPRRVLFVSSTSVYGQSDSEWIDETSPAEPRGFAGQRLLEAEQRLADSSLSHCLVRFSGIYGPGRQRLIQQVMRGEASPSEPPQFSNRIHADDCAGVLKHLIELEQAEPLYVASDCQPTPLQEVKQWIARRLQLADNHWQQVVGSPLRASKRIRNQRLLDSGYDFLHPTFESGYGPLVDDFMTASRATHNPTKD